MKKVLGMVAVLMLISASVFATETVKNGKYGAYVDGAYAIGDVGSGYAANVDSSGALKVAGNESSVFCSSVDAEAAPANSLLKQIVFSGATAGDKIVIQDGATDGVTRVKFNYTVPAYGQGIVTIPGGLRFTTDIYVNVTYSGAGAYTIVYE